MVPIIGGGWIVSRRVSTVTLRASIAIASLLTATLLATPSLAFSGVIWTEQAKLTASDGARFDTFGTSVAIESDTAVVGAPGNNPLGPNPLGLGAGSAYVFVRDPWAGTWAQAAKLSASDLAAGDNFGFSVAISGDTILVGSPRDDDFRFIDAGSAYVFVRDSWTGSWSEQAKLTASDRRTDDEFGFSVAISGDIAVIGAPFHDKDVLLDAGSAYVFVRDPATGTWTQQAELTASDAGGGDEFGSSVSVSGGTALVGAPFSDRSPLADFGAAYVFVWCPEFGTWQQQAKLSASDGAAFDAFGFSVAIDYDTAVVGAPRHDKDALRPDAGSAYIFVRDPWSGVWTERAKLSASDAAAFDEFGRSVAISCDTVLVGAPRNVPFSGSAYVFVRHPWTGIWSQQARLDASDKAPFDQFGRSVAIDDDTAVVGAPFHGFLFTGAAYVFVRVTCCQYDLNLAIPSSTL